MTTRTFDVELRPIDAIRPYPGNPRVNDAAADARGMHHQGFDLARDKSKSKPTTRKMRAKDRPLENDFVSDEAFDQMLLAWFSNASFSHAFARRSRQLTPYGYRT